MPAESTAVLLRRAATRLDELAKGATSGPWARRRPGACYLDAAAPADEHPAFVRSGRVEVIRAAVWEGTGGEFVRARTDRDLDWIAALSPVVAAPLAAWLRDVAEDEEHEQRERTEHCPECDGTGQVYDGDPLPFPCSDCLLRRDDDWPPLAAARALLGETETTDDR